MTISTITHRLEKTFKRLRSPKGRIYITRFAPEIFGMFIYYTEDINADFIDYRILREI
jgi:hypothetical protein